MGNNGRLLRAPMMLAIVRHPKGLYTLASVLLSSGKDFSGVSGSLSFKEAMIACCNIRSSARPFEFLLVGCLRGVKKAFSRGT